MDDGNKIRRGVRVLLWMSGMMLTLTVVEAWLVFSVVFRLP